MPEFVEGLPTDFSDVTFLFFSHSRSPIFVSNLLFGIELADKKNFIFSFFVFSKLVQAKKIQPIANHGLTSL